jgi:hypothetical protein
VTCLFYSLGRLAMVCVTVSTMMERVQGGAAGTSPQVGHESHTSVRAKMPRACLLLLPLRLAGMLLIYLNSGLLALPIRFGVVCSISKVSSPILSQNGHVSLTCVFRRTSTQCSTNKRNEPLLSSANLELTRARWIFELKTRPHLTR